MTFDDLFLCSTGFPRHDWQARLAADQTCRDRLIRIPTGFGKTAGVTLAWLWHRVVQNDHAWPRRLVLCLPMRTLVEQTKRAVEQWLKQTGLGSQVNVCALMGGLSHEDWHLEPEQDAVLIGTQDMLLSRALNRGYGLGRARWPMEYALLNVDCLWVMDEIQLMDIGLATSAQLQGFARCDEQEGKLPRPRKTWWMSATLQRDWLRCAPDLAAVNDLPIIQLEESEKVGPLWAVAKDIRSVHLPAVDDLKAERWAELVVNAHSKASGGVTLVIANTVKSAVALHRALQKRKEPSNTALADINLQLVHSRFRGAERREWVATFLSRERCGPDANRIVVATQVVEAGVDISAKVLVTELAPWASLVQRFGRCARYGGEGQVVVVDRRHTDESARKITATDDAERDKKRRDVDRSTMMPYELEELEAAADAVASLNAAGPAALDNLEDERQDLLPRLYPYAPLHVLTRRELRDLFDTGPDLTGADIDISRFVREGDERDVTVWWWPVPEGRAPHKRLRPAHDALCRVPIRDARKWLVAGAGQADESGSSAKEVADDGARRESERAWVWSYLDGEWERLEARHVYPGQTILVDRTAGGYDDKVGFTGRKADRTILVEAEHARAIEAADAADAADEQDELSESSRQYKTVATHCCEVAVEAQRIAEVLALPAAEAGVLGLAGVVHDIGKAHPAFAAAIRDRNNISSDTCLAKAPKGRWHWFDRKSKVGIYDHSQLGKRPTFRHELASALALLEIVWRTRPDHPAMQGGREQLLDLTVRRDIPAAEDRITNARGVVAQLVHLDEIRFNLVAYVVMCHHGKVRATLPMSAHDQDNPDRNGNLPIRGVRDGDILPALALGDTYGCDLPLPPLTLRLDAANVGLSRRYGPSWVERVLALRKHYGDFQLAWFETLLRVADVRASQIAEPRDSRLPVNVVEIPSVPEAQDRNVELRAWIHATLASAMAEPHGAKPRGNARGRSEPKRASAPRGTSPRDTPGGTA